MHYVYVLKLKNDQLYTGRTDDLKRRLLEHTNGKAEATKDRRPLRLVYYESFINKLDAIRRERYFKTTKGKKTIRLMLRESLK